jgi:predicted ATP-dependent serine protease
MKLYTCNECGLETIFSSGLCSDCQLWAGRYIPDIVADFHAEGQASSATQLPS